MVADEVEIDTLSYQDGAAAVHWTCDGGTDYELSDGTKDTVGTEMTLHLNEDCLEFANEYRAREYYRKILLLHADRDLSLQGKRRAAV